MQPVLQTYPMRIFSQGPRAFNPSWYRSRTWLEYSAKLACFCFPCRQFGARNDEDITFIRQGFTNWKTAMFILHKAQKAILRSNEGQKKFCSCAMRACILSPNTEKNLQIYPPRKTADCPRIKRRTSIAA